LKYDILTQNIFMKELVMKLSKSVVAILALSAISFAGGKITPEPAYHDADIKAAEQVVVEQPKVVEEKVMPVEVAPVAAAAMGGYVGLAGSSIALRTNGKQANAIRDDIADQDNQSGLTLVGGYDFMENLGAEVRGTRALWDLDGQDKIKSYGAYLKPQVDLGGVNLYGLAGYAKTKAGAYSENDFSYGAGLDFPLADGAKLFIDAVQLIDKGDVNAMSANAGLKYQF
jgi:hypothetical protein